jgi:hypothetical protein
MMDKRIEKIKGALERFRHNIEPLIKDEVRSLLMWRDMSPPHTDAPHEYETWPETVEYLLTALKQAESTRDALQRLCDVQIACIKELKVASASLERINEALVKDTTEAVNDALDKAVRATQSLKEAVDRSAEGDEGLSNVVLDLGNLVTAIEAMKEGI